MSFVNGRRLTYLLAGAYLLRRFLRYFGKSDDTPNQQKVRPSLSNEELRQFLPIFLSQGSQKAFIDEIKYFLTSQPKPFYTSAWADTAILFQGDGLKGLSIINLPDPTIKSGSALLLSNTCDMDISNQRLFDSSLIYTPIFSLQRYLGVLSNQFPKERVSAHESDIRQQLITQIFFLPQGAKLSDDSIVFLDRLNSAPSNTVDLRKVPQNRLFTLSDFGAWLLALKLSIHFCRIRDRVDRNAGKIVL
jgi:hypothetical protein